MGLLGLDRLEREEGVLLVMPGWRSGKKGFLTSIQMLGMRFPICAAWLDQEGMVVHSTLAKPNGFYYGSPYPAWYVLEVHPDLLESLPGRTEVNWFQAAP